MLKNLADFTNKHAKDKPSSLFRHTYGDQERNNVSLHKKIQLITFATLKH